MAIEIDLPGHVSDELATVMEFELNDEEAVQPVTLSSVLASMHSGLVARLIEEERLDDDPGTSIFGEIKLLIEEYGSDALAQCFVRPSATENLAYVIQAVMERREQDLPPTLAYVREAMGQGIVAELVGIGDIDLDEDEMLIPEIDHLINRYGENMLAEDLLP
jgi:hypothetical protein